MSNLHPYPQLHAGRDEPILEPELKIIDSAHHLFDRPALRYMAEDYLTDVRAGHRIVASIFVETLAFTRMDDPELFKPLAEVEFANGVGAMAASGVYGECLMCAGIVGHADLRFGSKVGELLDAALARAPRRFRGVRQITIEDSSDAPFRYVTVRPASGIMRHPKFYEGFREVATRNLVFDAAVFHHQLGEIARLADAFPDTHIVVNHVGQGMAMGLDTINRKIVLDQLRASLLDLGKRPNVSCKIGGMGLPFWGFGLEKRVDLIGYLELARTWQPLVDMAIEAFGPRRCMMESNYPPDGRAAGFVPLWNALKYMVRGASMEDKVLMFHDNAARIYRLEGTEIPS